MNFVKDYRVIWQNSAPEKWSVSETHLVSPPGVMLSSLSYGRL